MILAPFILAKKALQRAFCLHGTGTTFVHFDVACASHLFWWSLLGYFISFKGGGYFVASLCMLFIRVWAGLIWRVLPSEFCIACLWSARVIDAEGVTAADWGY